MPLKRRIISDRHDLSRIRDLNRWSSLRHLRKQPHEIDLRTSNKGHALECNVVRHYLHAEDLKGAQGQGAKAIVPAVVVIVSQPCTTLCSPSQLRGHVREIAYRAPRRLALMAVRLGWVGLRAPQELYRVRQRDAGRRGAEV